MLSLFIAEHAVFLLKYPLWIVAGAASSENIRFCNRKAERLSFLFGLFSSEDSGRNFPKGNLLCRLSLSVKGGDAMYVTYSDLIQIGLLIVAIVALFRDR